MRCIHALGLSVIVVAVPAALMAQKAPADTAVRVTWGAFVDGYYAWDFQQPPNFDRSFAGGALFTTQPARHNEFNINLAFVEAKLDGQRVRGRVALQAGTSVQSNYAGEPSKGQVSGATLSRHIQEAAVGVRLSDRLWLDGGIFFSHMGMESWLSRDNPTYTRSLVAEYSPYYQSGAKLTWAATSKLTAQLDVVNGWQNISENNRGKGVGIRLDYTPTTNSTLSYYNFVSQEAGTRLRAFNGVGAKVVSGRATFLGEFDVGMQERSDGNDRAAKWYGFTGVVRGQLSSTIALSARVERFDDRHQVIIATGALDDTPNAAFRANGASMGIDWSPQSRFLWRSEVRGWLNDGAVFPNGVTDQVSKRSAYIVSALTLTF